MTQRGVVLVGDVAAIGLGVLAQRALAHRKDEPIARAWGRTFSWRIAVGGLAGRGHGDQRGMLVEGIGGERARVGPQRARWPCRSGGLLAAGSTTGCAVRWCARA